MGFSGYKIRQLWLPFLILTLVILAVSWILAGVVYPSNVQGNDEQPATFDRSTPTSPPTATSIVTTQSTATNSADATTPTSTTSILNCTYTMGYWRTYPDAWLIENIIIGDYSFTKAEAIVILENEARDTTTRLLQQFITALLNKLKGADSSAVEETLVRTSDWLTANSPEVDLTQEQLSEALELVSELEDYNNGVIGPGHCVDEPVTATPRPSATPTITNTPTPIPTIRLRTPTPTEKEGGGPKPTKPPPSAPTNTPPQPTEPPPPQPTNTRQPPTEAPTLPPPTAEP
jgi:hypothetical protein